MKYFILLSTLINLCLNVKPQTLMDIGAPRVVELECVQSNTTNTFITCAKERYNNGVLDLTRAVLKRSIDNGNTWSQTGTIGIVGNELSIGDPVITVDSQGVFYTAFMRVKSFNTLSSILNIDIELYSSLDDGISWNYVSSPHLHSGFETVDYPQIISRGNGELYITYSLFQNSIMSPPDIVVQKSTDGGVTWNYLNIPSPIPAYAVGPDLTWGKGNKIHLTYGITNAEEMHEYVSTDYGNTWHLGGISSYSGGAVSCASIPFSNVNIPYISAFSIVPHALEEAIIYHYKNGTNWQSYILDNGAYPQGYITDDGLVHIVYNKKNGPIFEVKYMVSNDSGATFSAPINLYSGVFDNTEAGEYQSFLLGNDGNFYLAFCDWSANSDAKMLVFSPNIISGINEEKVSKTFDVFPNPTSDLLNINFKGNLSAKSIHLTDIDGKTILDLPIKEQSKDYVLNMSSLNNGIYLLFITEANRYLVQKIVKE